jgi:hypothetical protein
MDFHEAERYLRGVLLVAFAIWSSFIAYDNRAKPRSLVGSALVALFLLWLAYFAIGSWPVWDWAHTPAAESPADASRVSE